MILTPKCYTREWLLEQAARTGTQDVVLEKCIHALTLVAALSEESLEFVFKGGTSLMLHLNPVRRLSIDVDIASLEPLDRVTEVLGRICNGKPFKAWSHQDWRDGENPPTKYFKLTYDSALRPGEEDSVQLDVLVTKSPHPVIEEKVVIADFVELEREVKVRIPSLNCLLGDKLAAFAPTTIGVLYQPYSKKTGEPTEPRPIRVMKQLFDVGELFAAATDQRAVAASYRQHFEVQNTFRGGKFTIENALEDTLGAAYSLCQIDLKPQIDDGNRAFFRTGMKALGTHLIRSNFTLSDSKTAAARAALLASHIKSGNTGKSLAEMRSVPSDVSVLKSLRIDGRWKKLHTLRKTNIEAFYLWHLAHLEDASKQL